MKKILNRIGNGFKKLKTSRKFKSIITAILVVVMIIDVNPFFLKAGRESLVYKFENGVQHPFAFDNNPISLEEDKLGVNAFNLSKS